MVTFSNQIKVNNFQIKSTEPIYSNQSWTGQRIIRSTGIQYYQIQFQLSFNIKERAEVTKFIAEYSQGKPFQMSLGHLSTYTGTQTGAVTVQTSVNKGSMIIPVSTNTLAVGEWIQFTNHKKIYRIVEQSASSITIFPALNSSVQASEPLFYDNLVIEAVLDTENDYSMPVETVSVLQLKAMEHIT
ncbi:hypothetical protein EDF81_0082 [Enterobacter sp. BIGb0383]|uniref:hypothetical protein n=1 Tax=unclassified Enterobacter TaxID=2608935 RepID=UPI000F49C33B|nr:MULTISPECIES: hypothetical protein [unclassified Enterobacter]ROP61611.1 hypothetical protein EDF81_0082 [Enterobacter sp. BIGb0383]ROS11772.1 hypothetical protein EC848_0082 [Enterobacter sp. BIGb0359]